MSRPPSRSANQQNLNRVALPLQRAVGKIPATVGRMRQGGRGWDGKWIPRCAV